MGLLSERFLVYNVSVEHEAENECECETSQQQTEEKKKGCVVAHAVPTLRPGRFWVNVIPALHPCRGTQPPKTSTRSLSLTKAPTSMRERMPWSIK